MDPEIRTVSIHRSLPDKSDMDITVAFVLEGRWAITHILDEYGNEIILTEAEEALAHSLVESGVDEPGR